MIARLAGEVLERENSALVINVQGVGYRVTVLESLLRKTQTGDTVALYIHHHVGDGIEDLFGFGAKESLRYFVLLLTVPSVGPRTAMNILDIAPPKTLAQAVATGDVALLTKVSGVGRKTAERILVELKEKFKKEPVSGMVGEVQADVVSALINLGYTSPQAREVVQKLPASVSSVEEAIRMILQGQQ